MYVCMYVSKPKGSAYLFSISVILALVKLEKDTRHLPMVYNDTIVYTLSQVCVCVCVCVCGGGGGGEGGLLPKCFHSHDAFPVQYTRRAIHLVHTRFTGVEKPTFWGGASICSLVSRYYTLPNVLPSLVSQPTSIPISAGERKRAGLRDYETTLDSGAWERGRVCVLSSTAAESHRNWNPCLRW